MSNHSTYKLSHLAECGDPDSIDRHGLSPDSIAEGREFTPSPGAVFLRRVEDDYNEAREGDYAPNGPEEWEDRLYEIADSAVPIYTHERWLVFVDLAAWEEDLDGLAGDDMDVTERAGVALYEIAHRLLTALLAEVTDADADEWGEK